MEIITMFENIFDSIGQHFAVEGSAVGISHVCKSALVSTLL